MLEINKQLLRASSYPHVVGQVKHIETHISHVFLAGKFAYKIKKPLNLGFLDFSTLKKRQYFCQEELRLNSRLAKDIYIDVVPIVSNNGRVYVLDDSTKDLKNVVEYAVRMHRFDTSMELDQLLEQDKNKIWKDEWIDTISQQVANFHLHTTPATPDSNYGKVESIFAFTLENFSQIKQYLSNSSTIKTVNLLQQWIQTHSEPLSKIIKLRRIKGLVRECHGDMHLANMVYWNKKVQIFDGIEFNEKLRWIDVISEIAFLIMDLESREKSHLAWRFLNRYLLATGDYSGLELLNFYRIYRACVRAKVSAIRYQQFTDSKQQDNILSQANHYLNLAKSYTESHQTYIVMLHGLSGSGKSTLSATLAQYLQAIHIQSDVERKRLFGIFSSIEKIDTINTDMYSAKASSATYKRLLKLATLIVESGFPVIVDATFLMQEQRQMFYQIFDKNNIPIVVVNLQADEDKLYSRVTKRSQQKNSISDADLSVLKRQIQLQQQPSDTEANVLTVDANALINSQNIAKKITELINETH